MILFVPRDKCDVKVLCPLAMSYRTKDKRTFGVLFIFCIILIMTGTRLRKALIIIILAVFLLITGLTSVMYLTGNVGTATTDTGTIIDT